jgi:hypothetical protein
LKDTVGRKRVGKVDLEHRDRALVDLSRDLRRLDLPAFMREHPEPRPRDDKDAAQDIARDLADIAGQLASLKGEANASLSDPNYNTLKLRHQMAHSATEAPAMEARRRVRLNEG